MQFFQNAHEFPGRPIAAGTDPDKCEAEGSLLRYSRLKEKLLARGKVAIAFSGGVDSSLVLHTARKVLGNEVLALHARMPWQSQAEDEHVRSVARYCDSRLVVLDINPLEWPEFVANPADRCYHCKKRIFTHFLKHGGREGFTNLVDGTNADDLYQFRPGLAALEELGVGKPLAEAGLGKKEIRRISRKSGLPTWNLPPGSCLATRVACGEPVTMEKLHLVRAAEELLQERGYKGCRARLSRDTLLIELQHVDIKRFFLNATGRELIEKVQSGSIRKVYLDLEGRRELDEDGRFS